MVKVKASISEITSFVQNWAKENNTIVEVVKRDPNQYKDFLTARNIKPTKKLEGKYGIIGLSYWFDVYGLSTDALLRTIKLNEEYLSESPKKYRFDGNILHLKYAKIELKYRKDNGIA